MESYIKSLLSSIIMSLYLSQFADAQLFEAPQLDSLQQKIPRSLRNLLQKSNGITDFKHINFHFFQQSSYSNRELNKDFKNTYSSPSSFNLNYEDIQSMPVRNLDQIIAVSPGISYVRRNFHMLGSEADDLALYVDGIYMVNPFTLKRVGNLNINSIESLSISAGEASAEQGDWAAVNVTTRSGGDKFRVKSEVLSDEFLSKSSEENGTYSYGNSKYNISLSGPLYSDNSKFYISGDYDWRRDRIPSSGPHAVLLEDGVIWDTIIPSSAPTGDVKIPRIETVKAFETFGARPNNWLRGWNFNGNISLEQSSYIIRIGGISSTSTERIWNSANDLLNSANNPRLELSTQAWYARLSQKLSDRAKYNIQFTSFSYDEQTGDNVWWDDFENYGDKSDWNDDGLFNSALRYDGLAQRVANHFALYNYSGGIYDDYSHINTGYANLDGTLDLNYKTHDIKFGGIYRKNQIKFYRLANPMRISAVYSQNPDSIGNTDFEQKVYQASYTANIGFNYKGEEEDISDSDRARHPINSSLFIQDRFSIMNIQTNIGVRWDYFDFDLLKLIIPDPLVIGGGNNSDSNNEPVTFSFYNPRIGLSKNILKYTNLYTKYGVFYQPAAILFSTEPEKQTNYTFGLRQIVKNSFYLSLEYFVLENDSVSSANGSILSSNGLIISLNILQTNGFSGYVSYLRATTNLYLKGDLPGQVFDENYFIGLKTALPAGFGQTNTFNINLDYHFSRDASPKFIRRSGINIIYNYDSGGRYSPTFPRSEIFSSNITFRPTAGVNSSNLPSISSVDVRINRPMVFRNIELDLCLLVFNLFNSLNVIDVYTGTGKPDDDGFFTTPSGNAYRQSFPNGADLYSLRVNNPNNFGEPRQVLLGLRVNL